MYRGMFGEIRDKFSWVINHTNNSFQFGNLPCGGMLVIVLVFEGSISVISAEMICPKNTIEFFII